MDAEDDFKFINFLSENKTVTNAYHGQIVTLECLVNLAKPDARINWQRMSNRKFFISNTKENNNDVSMMSKRKVSKKRLTGNSHVNSNGNLEDDEIMNSIDGLLNRKRFTIVGESNLQIENVNHLDEDDYICSASYTIDEFNITEGIKASICLIIIFSN